MRAMLTGMLALMVTAILVEVARRVAPAIGLVDRPSERKLHQGEIPLVGGIAIFTGLLAIMVMQGLFAEHWSFFAAAAVLVAVGAWDDVRGISPLLRLGLQG